MPAPSPADGLKTLVTSPVLTVSEVQTHTMDSLGVGLCLDSGGRSSNSQQGHPPESPVSPRLLCHQQLRRSPMMLSGLSTQPFQPHLLVPRCWPGVTSMVRKGPKSTVTLSPHTAFSRKAGPVLDGLPFGNLPPHCAGRPGPGFGTAVSRASAVLS